MTRRLLVSVVLGVLSISTVWLLQSAGLLDAAERETYDWRLTSTARAADARQDIVLLEINESSLQILEPVFGRWPWPRAVHAGAIDFLARAGARVIAYDVLFVDRDLRGEFPLGPQTMTGAASDAMLVESVQKAGNVILAAETIFEGMEGGTLAGCQPPATVPGPPFATGPGFDVRPCMRLPYPDLAAAAAGVGHTFLVKDPDGTARRVRPFVESGGHSVPWLGTAAAIAAAGVPPSEVTLEGDTLRVGAARVPLLADPVPPRAGESPQPSRQMLLRLRGPYAQRDGTTTYRTYSFFDVLKSEEQLLTGETPTIAPSVFKDKVVFVGITAVGAHDVLTTPFGESASTPGIYLHAATADDLLSGRFMRKAVAAENATVVALAGMAAAFIAVLLPVAWAVVLVGALAAGATWALSAAIGSGLWLSLVTPLAAVAIALFGGTAWQYFVEGRGRRQMTRLFGRYVSPDVFAALVNDPSLASLGGQRREMTVLFSDIRGFTTASEQGAPEEVVAQLNEYFTAMVEVLFRHRGTLDKFVGDMVMGLFGAPVADPRHADHAVAAAIEMMATLDRLNAAWAAAGRPALDIGIGINSGEMIAGNIGSDTIMSYTVIGDAVNLGARLESLNKDYGTRILISEATRSRLTTAVRTRPVGDVVVKGKTHAVLVHEVEIPNRS